MTHNNKNTKMEEEAAAQPVQGMVHEQPKQGE
jgi:hypothetical protein